MANYRRFSPNLDDGQQWLPPSDIFVNEVGLRPPSFKHSNSNSNYPTHISCMEDLAAHFAALSFLKNHHRSLTHSPPISKPPLILNSQRLKMAVCDHMPPGYVGYGGRGEGGGGAELSHRYFNRYGGGSNLTRPDPFYEFLSRSKQGDGFLEETMPRVLQRQRNHFQSRIYPFKGNGSGGGGGCGGGAVRESGGTGVFHPRIVNPTVASCDSKRKQSIRCRQGEGEGNQNRNSMRRVMMKNQEECYYHLPPEMDLPQDWTY
ncbi:uncharacterized protein LOC126679251 [Mercurialis annua]|uniref:uncharacterized protein LOC126679251 n=1 Tax=Mercurialis annua TaxID=3986 RepID=UPI00215F20C5|nr:uncharacterized protein LOC126679251 [Mercurialis annua]